MSDTNVVLDLCLSSHGLPKGRSCGSYPGAKAPRSHPELCPFCVPSLRSPPLFQLLAQANRPRLCLKLGLGKGLLFEVVALWQRAFILEQFESFFSFFSLSLAQRRYMYLAKKGRILWHLPFGPLTSVLLGCGPSMKLRERRVIWGLGFSLPLCYMLCPAIDWLWA